MADKNSQTVKKKTVKHKNKSRSKKRGGSNILIYSFVILIIIAIVIILSLTVFFNANAVTVTSKSSFYTAEQIVSASGLDIGDSLITSNASQAEDRIEQQLPYIGTATVKKKFPSTFEITVKDVKPNRIYKANNNYALAYNDKILEITEQYDANYSLYNIPVKEAIAGKNVALENEIKEVYDLLNKSIKNSGLKNITAVSFTSAVDIKLIYDNRLLLDVGTTENLDQKLKNAIIVIKSVTQKHGEVVEGTVNLKYLVDGNNESYFTLESIDRYGILPETKSQENLKKE